MTSLRLPRSATSASSTYLSHPTEPGRRLPLTTRWSPGLLWSAGCGGRHHVPSGWAQPGRSRFSDSSPLESGTTAEMKVAANVHGGSGNRPRTSPTGRGLRGRANSRRVTLHLDACHPATPDIETRPAPPQPVPRADDSKGCARHAFSGRVAPEGAPTCGSPW